MPLTPYGTRAAITFHKKDGTEVPLCCHFAALVDLGEFVTLLMDLEDRAKNSKIKIRLPVAFHPIKPIRRALTPLDKFVGEIHPAGGSYCGRDKVGCIWNVWEKEDGWTAQLVVPSAEADKSATFGSSTMSLDELSEQLQTADALEILASL